jgi:hypothetical protein
MTRRKILTTVGLFSILFLSAPAFAGLPAAPEDIKYGHDLTAACSRLAEHDASEEGQAASKACSKFLGSMVEKVFKATEAGAPTQFNRVGPKQDQTLCFRLPSKLSFVDFSKLILKYARAHPELADRPAYETGAWTLAANFPCPKEAKPH